MNIEVDILDQTGRVRSRIDIKSLCSGPFVGLYTRLPPELKIMVEILVAAKINKNQTGTNRFKRNTISNFFTNLSAVNVAGLSNIFDAPTTNALMNEVRDGIFFFFLYLFRLTFLNFFFFRSFNSTLAFF